MSALHVALHALGAQHPAIEGKFLPRLETNDLIPTYFQLNAALLTTEAAMRFNQTLGGVPRFILPAAWRCVGRVGAEAVEQNIRRSRWLSHETPPSSEAAPGKAIFACTRGTVPATWHRCLRSGS